MKRFVYHRMQVYRSTLTFGDWMTKLMCIAEHRNTLCLNANDILEVARILSVIVTLPPREDLADSVETADWKTLDIAYLWDENEAKMPDLRSQLSLCDPNRTNSHVSLVSSLCNLIAN
jgi:hypothetical protein